MLLALFKILKNRFLTQKRCENPNPSVFFYFSKIFKILKQPNVGVFELSGAFNDLKYLGKIRDKHLWEKIWNNKGIHANYIEIY